jgi:hypothetical protein
MGEDKVEQIANWRQASGLVKQHGDRARFITLKKAVEALRNGAPNECRDWIEVTKILASRRMRCQTRY